MQKHADLVLIVVSIMSVILNDSIGRLVPFDYTLCISVYFERGKWSLPKKFYGYFEENIFFFFKDSFSQNYSFQNLFYVLTMFYYILF